jgi:DNA-binding MarR family transcriptional regulator
MAKADLITVKPNKADKRMRDVVITKKGLAALEGIDRYSEEMYDSSMPLSEEEARLLNDSVQRIINGLLV